MSDTHLPGFDVARVVEASAWTAFENNISENESELESLVEQYQDDTGESLNITIAQEMERGGELHDPAFKAWCVETVKGRCEELVNGLVTHAVDGYLTAWRAVSAPPEWTPQAPNCGIYWSYERVGAVAHFSDELAGSVIHIVEARIPLAAVDWFYTMKANLSQEFGDELELRIEEDGVVEVVSCEIENTNAVSAKP